MRYKVFSAVSVDNFCSVNKSGITLIFSYRNAVINYRSILKFTICLIFFTRFFLVLAFSSNAPAVIGCVAHM